MINQEKIELMYDIIDESCNILFETKKINYLNALIESCNNILNGYVSGNIDDEIIEKLENLYEKLNDDFKLEEIRKALQYLILNAFKEVRYKNGDLTPDSIAFLMAYLASKLLKKKGIKIYDPLVGSANLLTAVSNFLNEDDIYGTDNNEIMIKLASIVCNMQDYDAKLTLGDTLLSSYSDMDLIVSDVPSYDDDNIYFPYEFVIKHINSLKDNGYMILLLPNAFFEHKDVKIRDIINKDMNMIGLIELPKEFFKSDPKSIVILEKSKRPIKEFLLVQIPNMDDSVKVNRVLNKIENWFKKMEEEKNENNGC